MRVLPDRLKGSAWARLYQTSRSWPHLFRDASLRFAPTTTMDLVPGDLISSSIAFTGFYELPLSQSARITRRSVRARRGP